MVGRGIFRERTIWEGFQERRESLKQVHHSTRGDLNALTDYRVDGRVCEREGLVTLGNAISGIVERVVCQVLMACNLTVI